MVPKFFYLAATVFFTALTPSAHADDKVRMYGVWQADTSTMIISEALAQRDFSGNPKPYTEEGFGITVDDSGKIYWTLWAEIDVLPFVKAITYHFIFTNAPPLTLKLDPSQDVYQTDGSITRYGNITQDQVNLLGSNISASDSFTIQSTVGGELQSTKFDATGFTRACQAVFP